MADGDPDGADTSPSGSSDADRADPQPAASDRADPQPAAIGEGDDHLTAIGEADDHLAAVVAKSRVDAALDSLRAEGVYDDSRAIREHDEGTVSLPVTEPPTATGCHAVVRQLDPDFRRRGLEDLLAGRGWPEDAIAAAPGSWAVIGSVVVVSVPEGFPADRERGLGEALLELHGEADAVLADEGIAGSYREPRRRHLAGSRDTETVHTEHGTRYVLDPARVMFSPGNEAERVRMGELVEVDERVFDMFAGIGYFTLPMARAGARVTATEINPTAFRYLLENAALNDVTDRVDAFRTDCRTLAGSVTADRVVMGYYGVDGGDERAGGAASDDGRDGRVTDDDESDGRVADDDESDGRVTDDDESDGRVTDDDESDGRIDEAHEFLPVALSALQGGGVLHYHAAVPESLLWERPRSRLERATDRAGRTLEILDSRRVKSHSPGVAHVVVDARIGDRS